MKNRNFTCHVFALCFLFVLGNIVFSLPVNNINTFSFILLSEAVFFVSILTMLFLMGRCKKSKILFFVFLSVIFLVAAFGGVNTFLDFHKFLTHAQMPHTNSTLLLAALLLTVVVFSAFRLSAVLKYCLFAGFICILIIIICFASGIKNYDVAALRLMFTGRIFSLKAFFKYFSPLFCLSFWLYFKPNVFTLKNVFTGSAVGFAVLLITCLQTAFTLGYAVSDFGYLKAVSTISTGSLFSRLDGLVFFVCFASSIVKIMICFKTALFSLKNIFNKNPDFD